MAQACWSRGCTAQHRWGWSHLQRAPCTVARLSRSAAPGVRVSQGGSQEGPAGAGRPDQGGAPCTVAWAVTLSRGVPRQARRAPLAAGPGLIRPPGRALSPRCAAQPLQGPFEGTSSKLMAPACWTRSSGLTPGEHLLLVVSSPVQAAAAAALWLLAAATRAEASGVGGPTAVRGCPCRPKVCRVPSATPLRGRRGVPPQTGAIPRLCRPRAGTDGLRPPLGGWTPKAAPPRFPCGQLPSAKAPIGLVPAGVLTHQPAHRAWLLDHMLLNRRPLPLLGARAGHPGAPSHGASYQASGQLQTFPCCGQHANLQGKVWSPPSCRVTALGGSWRGAQPSPARENSPPATDPRHLLQARCAA